jgi:hypothetical protein
VLSDVRARVSGTGRERFAECALVVLNISLSVALLRLADVVALWSEHVDLLGFVVVSAR